MNDGQSVKIYNMVVATSKLDKRQSAKLNKCYNLGQA